MDEIQDLENWSRASNLCFVRIPESVEGRDILGFMSKLIPQFLFPTPLVTERAHHTPTFRHNDRAGPRPILIKLLNFQDKVKILCLAREKGELVSQGVYIYPDFSADLMKKRRSFDPVKRSLRELNLKYSLRYPSTLSVIVNGKPQLFTCHRAAEAAFMTSSSSPETPMSSSPEVKFTLNYK